MDRLKRDRERWGSLVRDAGRATRRRRAEQALAFLALGVLGLVLLARARRGWPVLEEQCDTCRRSHRRRRHLVALAGAVHLTLGVIALLAYPSVHTCAPPAAWGERTSTAFVQPAPSPWVTVRRYVTAGPSGGALVYGAVRGAETCLAAGNGAIVAMAARGFPRHGVMIGSVFNTYPKPGVPYPVIEDYRRHEGRHIDQWAVAVPLGGPLALPAVYAAVEAFFPGEHNFLERAAGLSDGGYPVPDGPSPASQRLIVAGMAVAAMAALRRRITSAHRRRHTSKQLAGDAAATAARHRAPSR